MTDFSYPILGEECKLPFYVVGIGGSDWQHKVRRDEGYPYYQMIYCMRGEGTLRVDGNEYIIAEGQGFYLPPNVPHEYFKNQEIWETHWITFDGREILNLLDVLGFSKAMTFKIADIMALDAIFKKILYILKTNYYYSGYQSSGLLYQLLLEINRLSNYQTTQYDSHKINQLQPVLDYIDANFQKDLTLEELSNLIALSPQYLCRLFKECLNLRPFEYLARKRVQEAKSLLLDGNYTINEIAETVGYNDCSYFCAVFKRHEMLSPAEFRTLHKK